MVAGPLVQQVGRSRQHNSEVVAELGDLEILVRCDVAHPARRDGFWLTHDSTDDGAGHQYPLRIVRPSGQEQRLPQTAWSRN